MTSIINRHLYAAGLFLQVTAIAFLLNFIALFLGGCAQIGMPTGGTKDTLAPVLVKSTPDNASLQYKGNKITLHFDEYVELQDISNHVMISPFPKKNPVISSNLKTVTIKLKDSLLPNTTYHIQFGDAIKDINEGNVLKNFDYVFSTGQHIDSLELSGKVVMAESGKTDSTLWALLYLNAPDSAVKTRRPDYISRLNGKGEFSFHHLPAGTYKLYALKDGDGNKYFNAKSEAFAFLNEPITLQSTQENTATLYAYVEKKPMNSPATKSTGIKKTEKYLKYSTSLIGGKQDLLAPFIIHVDNGLKEFNKDSVFVLDTLFAKVKNADIQLDSSRKNIKIYLDWKPDIPLMVLLNNHSMKDSSDLSLKKNDTIHFVTKSTEEYGSLKLSFKHINLSRHPILQLFEGETLKWKFALQSAEWKKEMILPGEYEASILLDENNDGYWDAGNYDKKLQPEKVISLKEKIRIKANWDNELEVEIPD